MKRIKQARKILLAIWLSSTVFVLIGCDGGIFGTGDGGIEEGSMPENGGSDISDSGTTSGAGDSDTTGGSDGSDGTDAGAGGGTDGGTDAGTSDGSSATTPQPIAFTNDLVATSRTDALITIVNVSTINTSVLELDTQGLPSTLALVPTNTSTDHFSLDPAQSHQIDYLNADSSTTDVFFTLSPVLVSAGTVSTFIVRGNAERYEVLPLATETTANDATLARIRLIFAANIDNPDAAGNIRLGSSGTNPGGGEHTFTGISYNNPIGNYIELPAGDYELSDSASRFEIQPISFTGGTSTTIIVTDNLETPLLIEDDSTITLSP
ncbi:MAG: DUF4397 domain-containing protein [Gammaproteobacteria bacterium]|nr:DUF4397 domain-containing protein [Gammaproteobacteria bacterium]